MFTIRPSARAWFALAILGVVMGLLLFEPTRVGRTNLTSQGAHEVGGQPPLAKGIQPPPPEPDGPPFEAAGSPVLA
jgi:hypothetical protein